MVSTLKFLIKSQLKRSRLVQQVNGFTMIELLIAMILGIPHHYTVARIHG